MPLTAFLKPAAKKARLLFAVLTAWSLFAAMAPNPVTRDQDFVLMTEKQELALGREMHAHILKEMGGEYEDARLKGYVSWVGNRLARKSHRSNMEYHFTILDNSLINAFALPGGYVYVTRGILTYINSEAELAVLLGHEIAHVAARHGVRKHGKATLAHLFERFVAERTGSSVHGGIAGALGVMVVHGYGRRDEMEADLLGTEYAWNNGYDVKAVLSLLRVLKHQGEFNQLIAGRQGQRSPEYMELFATHPHMDDRLRQARAKLGKLPTGKRGIRKTATFMSHINGLPFGDADLHGPDDIRRVKVVVVKKDETIASLAKSASLKEHKEQQLRLLNGLYPDGEPREGQLFKTVR